MKSNLNHRIPVIDLFAGPGGLAEGFSASKPAGWNVFKICLSIEKDLYAHRTLELRNFFRQFSRDQVPEEYYSYLRKEITRDELFEKYPSEGEAAKEEAWHAELGSESLSECEIDKRIKKALGGSRRWVLIGGPPCQAYSTAGRSRNKGKKGYLPENDNRHFLYREYLSIISRHWPSVFVMENVKGLLSARVNGKRIFDHILKDLHDPIYISLECLIVKIAYTSCTIIERDGRFFAAQRNVLMSLPLKWKFPGDKIKSGDSPFKFLLLEILEELGMGK